MKHTLLALTLTASSAFAQQPAAPAATAQVDARFSAWLGCWRLDDDLAGTGARMCITPEKGGVRLQTVAGSQKGIDELVIPDGAAHPITDTDCKGTERAEWSKDGARIFRTTDVTCGKEAPRTIRSVAFLAGGPQWINVQMMSGTAANAAVRVQRYRRAANQQLADGSKAPQPDPAAMLRSDPNAITWSVEDVIEASGKMPAEVVQAALAEVHQPFGLNKRELVALADGGVNSQVIDLMIALTYPKKFVVERRGGGSTPSGVLTGSGWFDPLMTGSMMSTSMLDCYTPFGYGYRSYYSYACGSLMGYDYYGYNRYTPYGAYGGYGGYGWVDIGSNPQVGGGTITEPQGEGRAIKGVGYAQIRNRESEPAPRVNSGGNGSAAGWSGNNGGSASSSGYSSGSASSGSSGGSSSSSGDSGARIAVPKGGGN